MRKLVLLPALAVLLTPAAAYANRSPGYLHTGEASAAIHTFMHRVGDIHGFTYDGAKVGICHRNSTMKVTCTGEARYIHDGDNTIMFCNTRYAATEAASGHHTVRRTAKRSSCHPTSLFSWGLAEPPAKAASTEAAT